MTSNPNLLASEITLSSLGQASKNKNNILLNDTTAMTFDGEATPYVRAVEALTDTTFTTLTGNLALNSESTLATGADIGVLYEGRIVYGKFSAVTLASGSVILYR